MAQWVRGELCGVWMCVCGSQRGENVLKSLGLANQGRLACAGPVNRALKWPVIKHWPGTSANNLKTWEHIHSLSDCRLFIQPYKTQQHTHKILNTHTVTATNKHRTRSHKQHDITGVYTLSHMYSIEIQWLHPPNTDVLLYTQTWRHTLNINTLITHTWCIRPVTVTQLPTPLRKWEVLACVVKRKRERERHRESLWCMTSSDLRSVGGAQYSSLG